jgi:aspartate/methionine/tyrosine aminotransferase
MFTKRVEEIPPFIVMDVLETAQEMERGGEAFSQNSYQTAFDILKRAHVGVTPGIDFGKNCQGYLRFSYANFLENIREGMNRLSQYRKER